MNSSSEATTFPNLGRSRFALLTTYRVNGDLVSTPMWFARRDGRLFMVTANNAGKLRRLRANPQALVAPCRSQGRPLGPAAPATVTLLGPDSSPEAAAALARRYFMPSWLIERFLRRRGGGAPPVYLALTPTETR